MNAAVEKLLRSVQHRWVRRTALIVLALVVLYGLFGYLVLPGIIQSQAQKAVTNALHRNFTIERVQVRPYALAVSIHGAKMYEADGKAIFASFGELQLRVSASSLWHLAPVVSEVHLVDPFVHLARTGSNHYSTDDIVAALQAAPPGPKPPPAAKPGGGPRFAVFNIQVDGGRFEFDDQPAQSRHVVSDLALGIPFVSSLPSQEKVFVEPHLSAAIDGAPIAIQGKALPFASTREAVVELALQGVDVPRYLAYLPFEPRFRLSDAKLDLNLQATFRQPEKGPAAVILSGKVALKSLRIASLEGEPILSLPQLVIELGKTEPLAGRVDVASISITGLELNVVKDARGALNLEMLAPPAPVPVAAAQEAAPAAAPKDAAAASPTMHVTLGKFELENVAVRFSDHNPAKPLEAAIEQFGLRVSDVALDPQSKRVQIGQIESDSAQLRVLQGGTAKGLPAGGATSTAPQKAAEARVPAKTKSPEQAPAPWSVSAGTIAVHNWQARIESRGLPQPAITNVTAITFDAENLSSASGGPLGSIKLKAGVNRGGALSVGGALGLEPLHGDLALDLNSVDLLALQPYFTEAVNVLVTRAELTTRGKFLLDRSSDGAVRGGFRGDFALGPVATIDKVNGNDFVNWKLLSLRGVSVQLAPLSVEVGQIALNDFYARVIVDPTGRINLQDIARSGGEQRSVTSEQPPTAAEQPQAAAEQPQAAAEEPQSAAAPAAKPQHATAAASSAPVPIKIGEVALQAGRVRFTDNFIKPNYTANLVDLSGTVTGLSSSADSSATVDLHGEVNDAPLTIGGQLNPLAADPSLDVKAGVHGMELAPLSPYSGKYVGYVIERGKLSFDVAYKLEHRQLNAQNRLVLDQLTFGEKVDSPSAISLPVRLAVSLLKDRNGVIDLDLPIGGSLDDPKFSVGAVIVKVLVNLVTKAVTAPFALLGSLFGGGEELSFTDCDPGSAEIPAVGQTRLKGLSKALTERPGLTLQIDSRVDPETDREGLRQRDLDRQLRTLKVKDLVAKGEAATVDTVTVAPEERPALLTRLYQQQMLAQGKPAQQAQAPKTPPQHKTAGGAAANGQPPDPAGMEKELLAGIAVPDDELVALGDHRSQAVKRWLQTTGQIPEQRLFLVATKVGNDAGAANQSKTAGKGGRVEFSLK